MYTSHAILQLWGVFVSIVLKLCNVSKYYSERQTCVLRGINLEISRGEFVALIGNSGAGKSTLLHIAGLLAVPTQGTVDINAIRCSPASDRIRTKTRRASLGFMYQSPNLMQELTVLENVMLPLMISNHKAQKAQQTAITVLAEVGLSGKERRNIAHLSGGEKQRVALARAIVSDPSLLLADEPTGSLDPQISNSIFSLIYENVKTKGLAALIATHNYNLAKKADTVYSLQNGQLTRTTL